MKHLFSLLVFIASGFPAAAASANSAGILRFPDVDQTRIDAAHLFVVEVVTIDPPHFVENLTAFGASIDLDEPGKWAVEVHGVEPDIKVIDDPSQMIDGSDPQLDRTIQLMLQEIKNVKVTRP